MNKKPRVLIADDEEGIRESLRLILDRDYEVEVAANGEETLAKLAKGRFDLLLLDMKMPKLDGIAVMRQLKEQQIAVPVLVLTAYQSVEFAKEAVRLGARDYLSKPFERKDVLSAVRDALTSEEKTQSKSNV